MKTQKVLKKINFDDIKYFSEGFCPVKINGYWNFINTEGTLVNNEKGYENVKDFKNGFCDNKYNYIPERDKIDILNELEGTDM